MQVKTAPITRDFNSELAARIKHVASRHSLSEIARRTGFAVSSIHSYCNGTRVPAELCAKLVREFSVNPAWLHQGEGAPFLDETNEGSANIGSEIVGLVAAMEAVSRMKLGAISGAQPLVRELDDALARHDQLQKRLYDRAKEVLGPMIEEAGNLLSERSFDAAQARLAAAGRLLHICTDPVLAMTHKTYEAMLARFQGRPADALVGFRDAYLRALALRDELGADCHTVAFNYANALQIGGEPHEAAVVCEAMLVLGGHEQSQPFASLNFQRGWLDVLTGELHRGLARMTSALPQIAEQKRMRIEAPRYMAAQLYAGLLSYDAADASTPHSPNKGGLLCLFAAFDESVERLERIEKAYCGGDARFMEDASGKFGGKNPIAILVDCLLRAMRKRDKQAASDYENAIQQSLPPGSENFRRFLAANTTCQIARLAGARDHALRRLAVAEECLSELGPRHGLNPLDLARFHKNAVQLGGARDRAKAFFDQQLAKGYMCMREYAATL